MQIKIDVCNEKTVAEPQTHTLKTAVNLCLKLPVLILFSLACSDYEGILNTYYEGYELLRGILINTVIAVLIMIIGNRNIIQLYQWFIYGVGILCIFGGITMSAIHNSKDRLLMISINHEPFSSDEIQQTSFEDLINACLFEFGRFISNVMIILVILDVDSWDERQEDEHEDDCFTKNFKKYSNWIFDCLMISVLLTFATVSSTVVIKIIHLDVALYKLELFGFEMVTGRVIWIVTYIGVTTIGLYKIYCFYRKINSVENRYPDYCVMHI